MRTLSRSSDWMGPAPDPSWSRSRPKSQGPLAEIALHNDLTECTLCSFGSRKRGHSHRGNERYPANLTAIIGSCAALSVSGFAGAACSWPSCQRAWHSRAPAR
jgi:hypothetical protein